MGQLGKIRRHQWKERLEISKIAKFESDTFLSERRYNSAKFRKFTDITVGGKFLPPTKWGGALRDDSKTGCVADYPPYKRL